MKLQKRWKRGRAVLAMLLCAGLLFGNSAGVTPRVSMAAMEGTVIASSLYVRSGPGTNYSKMTVNGQEVSLTKNTGVEVLGEENGWYRVKTTFSGKEVTGYVSGKYVSLETTPTPKPVTKPTATPAASSGTPASEFSVPAKIWVSELNVRQSAGTSGTVLDTLKVGTSLTVTGQTYVGTEKWYKVTYQTGGTSKSGYVYAPYVTLNAPIPTATPKPVTPPTPTKAPTQGGGGYATEFSVPAKVSASVLNVRSGAGTSNAIVTSLKYGATVTATGMTTVNGETWYRITFTENGVKKDGYVYGLYITLSTAIPTATPVPTATPTPTATPVPTKAPEPTQAPESSENTGQGTISYKFPAKVTATELNMRKGAGTDYDIVKLLKKDTEVVVVGEQWNGTANWYQIQIDGLEGYALSDYIALEYVGYPEAVLTEQIRLRSSASNSSSYVKTKAGSIAVLEKGNAVTLIGEKTSGGSKWFEVSCTKNGEVVKGYIPATVVKFGKPAVTPTPAPTVTPEPTATPTPTPAPTATPIPEATPTPTSAPEVTQEPEATSTPTSAPEVTQEPEATSTPTSAPEVTQEPEATSTPTSAPEVTQEPEATPTPTPAPTETPKPTATPAPTATPMPTATPAPIATPAAEAKENTPGVQVGWCHAVHPNASSMVLKVLPLNGVSSVKIIGNETRAVTVSATDYLMMYGKYVDEKGNLYRHVGVTYQGSQYYGYILEERVVECEAPATPTPTVTSAPGITSAPKVTPTPVVLPSDQAKENTPGEQVGWCHAIHPNASSMVLKSLPVNGAGSVKIIGNETRAVTVTSEDYLMLYGKYEDEKGKVYRHVGVSFRDRLYYGYILEERIVECEAPPTTMPGIDLGGSESGNQGISADFELNLTTQKFPESYKPYLRALHEKYPEWVFKAYQTNLVWDTAIAEENIPGKNLIPNSSGIAWKSLEEGAYNWKTDSFIVYDGSTWVTASKAALEYYMDPRNFLDEKSIFQFEVLTYEPSYQNLSGIENVLKYTPLYQTSYVYENEYGQYRSISYAETFIKAAEYSGVSPYHLATRVKQEVITGTTTVSNSVTGTVSGFEGLYNFYNIGAYHSTVAGGAIANGLKYAKYGSSTNEALNVSSLIPWDNRYDAIVGGAYIIGSSYINRGQNTIYLQKFNMTPYYTYSHQYMANVVAPSSEGKKTAQAYTGAMDSPIVFSIPVYLNMPTKACPEPLVAYNPNNYLSSLSVEAIDGTTYALTPSFNAASAVTYSVFVPNDTEVITVNAKAVSKKATVFGDGLQVLSVGMNTITVCVVAENGAKREYVLYVVRE